MSRYSPSQKCCGCRSTQHQFTNAADLDGWDKGGTWSVTTTGGGFAVLSGGAGYARAPERVSTTGYATCELNVDTADGSAGIVLYDDDGEVAKVTLKMRDQAATTACGTMSVEVDGTVTTTTLPKNNDYRTNATWFLQILWDGEILRVASASNVQRDPNYTGHVAPLTRVPTHVAVHGDPNGGTIEFDHLYHSTLQTECVTLYPCDWVHAAINNNPGALPQVMDSLLGEWNNWNAFNRTNQVCGSTVLKQPPGDWLYDATPYGIVLSPSVRAVGYRIEAAFTNVQAVQPYDAVSIWLEDDAYEIRAVVEDDDVRIEIRDSGGVLASEVVAELNGALTAGIVGNKIYAGPPDDPLLVSAAASPSHLGDLCRVSVPPGFNQDVHEIVALVCSEGA